MSKLRRFLPTVPPQWQDDAVCNQVDPELFYPEAGSNAGPAKRICAACDVRTKCLEYALAHDERFGVWGGKTEKERTEIKRRAGRTEVAA